MLLMGKSTISMVIFNSYVKLPEGKTWGFDFSVGFTEKSRFSGSDCKMCAESRDSSVLKYQYTRIGHYYGHSPSLWTMAILSHS